MKVVRHCALYALISLLCIGVGVYFGYGIPRGDDGLGDDVVRNALYQDPSQSLDGRVEDLLARMTTEEKIGQLMLVDKKSVRTLDDLAQYCIGGLLSGGGANPQENTREGWQDMVNEFQTHAQTTRLGIPLLYGVDAVHGHTNVFGATVFPHQIGLGAAADADLVARIGAITAQEMIATGIFWNFAPGLDVVRDTRWGRTYETFGSNTETVQTLGTAYINGLHSARVGPYHVAGTAKHFLGTGAMTWGSSDNPDFLIDQGDTALDEATLRAVHLPPFVDAVNAGVASVMVGHTSWNGTEIAANRYLLTDVLKEELGFSGFVVSDWHGVHEIFSSSYAAVVAAINAGVDLVMLPYDYKLFSADMARAVARGDIPMERLDDAVRRIARVKFSLGLFDHPLLQDTDAAAFGTQEHRDVAREAVRKSLVLLQDNQKTLPLPLDASRIVVVGSSAHNLGRQSGGWTLEWQGVDGNWFPGTTILEAIQQTVSPNTIVTHAAVDDFADNVVRADIGIAVVGEAPYAEGWGDNAHPQLSDEDLLAIQNVRAVSDRVVVIIVSGRPIDLRGAVRESDAIVAAWLPGTEGQGVTDVLFGVHPFTGTLPVDWPL